VGDVLDDPELVFLSATSDILIGDSTFSHQAFLLLLFLDHYSHKSTTTSFNYFRQHETAFMGLRKPLLRIAYSLAILMFFRDMGDCLNPIK